MKVIRDKQNRVVLLRTADQLSTDLYAKRFYCFDRITNDDKCTINALLIRGKHFYCSFPLKLSLKLFFVVINKNIIKTDHKPIGLFEYPTFQMRIIDKRETLEIYRLSFIK